MPLIDIHEQRNRYKKNNLNQGFNGMNSKRQREIIPRIRMMSAMKKPKPAMINAMTPVKGEI